MSTYAYHQVLEQAQHLTYAEQLQLISELAANLQKKDAAQPLHSILELEGLGQELRSSQDVN